MLRAALQARGPAPRRVDGAQVRHHLLGRLQQPLEASADAGIAALLAGLPASQALQALHDEATLPAEHPGVMGPVRLRGRAG